MANAVSFNYLEWVAQYPEFGCVTEATAQGYFDLATVYLRNDGCSVIPTDALQLTLLNLLTAHIAKLFGTVNGQPAQPVGRISSASEGSVSISTELPMTPTNAWYAQTTYGLMYWTATTPFRTMHYIPGPQPFLNGPFQSGIFTRRGNGRII